MAAATRLSPLTSAFSCSGCRRSIWAAIASSLRPAIAINQQGTGASRPQSTTRRLHTSRRVRSDERHAQDGIESINDSQDALDAAAEEHERGSTKHSKAPSPSKPTPWYLQEQPAPPKPEVNPFAERQRIPDLPSHPPDILQPLLQQISLDLGLDYLSILDLRRLNDPVPAFGVNLLMIIGSARSEKHLNVSADRLCRWLRTHYKLTPKADGLLGRNELKLKMRRKAKRSRIMTAAGGQGQIPDDGVNTGWICVSAGTVDGGLLPGADQDPTQAPGFIGFGSSARGAKIVVQMMTEEKREEIDLEGLWRDMLDRQLRREAGVERAISKEELAAAGREDDVYAATAEVSPQEPSGYTYHSTANQQSSPFQRGQQIRDFSTSRRRRDLQTTSSQVPAAPPPGSLFNSDSSTAALNTLAPPDLPPLELTRSVNVLSQHHTYLTNLSAAHAIYSLGQGQDDKSSTPFLRSYNSTLPTFRSALHFRYGIHLHCQALSLGHAGYTRKRLLHLLREAIASSVRLNRDLLLMALRTVVQAHAVIPLSANKLDSPRKESRAIIRRVFAYAKEVFEIMELGGHSLRQADIFKILHAAVMDPVFGHRNAAFVSEALQQQYATQHSAEELHWAYHNAPVSDDHAFVPRHEMSKSVWNAVTELYTAPLLPLPIPATERTTPQHPERTHYDTSLYADFMHRYLQHHDFSDFYGVWRYLPRTFRRRDASLYTILFEGQAEHGSMEACRRVVEEGVLEMGREEPAVGLGERDEHGELRLAKAVRACLVKAGLRRGRCGRPFVGVWEQLEGVLGVEEEGYEIDEGEVDNGDGEGRVLD